MSLEAQQITAVRHYLQALVPPGIGYDLKVTPQGELLVFAGMLYADSRKLGTGVWGDAVYSGKLAEVMALPYWREIVGEALTTAITEQLRARMRMLESQANQLGERQQ